ncbi:MAG: hypothetical protein HS101_02440 [Planctomycetia bacterium]|nr:hypothetical protein [Planctomycetia bacterium]
MNKKTLVLCACVAMVFASTAMAQSVIWCDVRANSIATNPGTNANLNAITGGLGGNQPFLFDNVNGGRKGGGQTLYLEPVRVAGVGALHTDFPTAFPNAVGINTLNGLGMDGDRSDGDIWVYMDVNDDASGTGDVISSLGLDVVVTPPATPRNTMTATFEMMNDGSVFNQVTPAGSGPWNSKIDTFNAGGANKAVRVPVEAGPTYNAALGIQPRPSGLTDMPYRVGRIGVQAGTFGCVGRTATYRAQSTYEIRLKANNLLVTRVFNGAGDAVEMINYGYDAAGAPEGPAISGNDTVSVSALADATVVIDIKGDFTGDGRVTSADAGPMGAAAADTTDNQFQAFFGDFSGDSRVTSADIGGFVTADAVDTPCP